MDTIISLSHTKDADHHVIVGERGFSLVQTTRIGMHNKEQLILFLQKVLAAPQKVAASRNDSFLFGYEPVEDSLCLTITDHSTGRIIAMGLSTAQRLLEALKTETPNNIEDSGRGDLI